MVTNNSNGFEDSDDINQAEHGTLIKPLNKIRSGWEEAFKKMALRGDDKLLDTPSATEWDIKEWEWK